MSKERLDYVDILKGIGILLVIFSHSGAEGGAMLYVGGVFIPLFFIASGYTYKHKEESFVPFLAKRARKLLVPYVFFSVLLLVLYKRFAPVDVFGVFYSRYCLYPFNSNENVFLMGGGNPPLWFLTSMLTAFVPFYLLMRYPSKVKWLLCLYALYTWGCQFLPILLPWSLDTACLQASFMFMGRVICKDVRLLSKPLWVYLLILAGYILCCTVNGELNVSVREYGLSFILYFISGSLGTWFLLRVSRMIEGYRMGMCLAAIGRHSLVIFCIQMFLLRICHQLFHTVMHLPTEGVLFYAVSLVKVLLVAIMGVYVSRAMNRYVPWLFK